MPKIPNVYIKNLDDDNDRYGSDEAAAFIFLGFKPWNEMFSVLSRYSPDNNFFCNPRNFKKWNIAAAGELLLEDRCGFFKPGAPWDENAYGPMYYPCSTKVAHAFKRQGYGDLLYKTMLLAAKAHAKKMKFKKWYFGPHMATSCGSTSPAAMRVYKSLLRKGYLKKTEWNNIYTVNKLPKNFKLIFY